jgi:hypothetical protein
MAQTSKSVLMVNLGSTNTNPANQVTGLAASSTVNRYIRGYSFTNNSSTPCTVNFAIATGAVLTANNSILFGATLGGVGTAVSNVFTYYFPGRGHRVNNQDVMAFASTTGCSLTVIYDEAPTADA